MIESEAEVLRVENGHAWVRIRPHTPCGNCDPVTGCKSVAMSRLFSGNSQEYRVLNPLSAQAGDLVRVAVADGLLLDSALWGYGLPLGLMLAGAGACFALAPANCVDLATLAGAAAGVAVALLLLRKRQQLPQAEPEIVEKRAPGTPLISTCKNNSNS